MLEDLLALTCQVCVSDGIFVILAFEGLQDDSHEQHQQDVVAKYNPCQYKYDSSKISVSREVELDIVVVFQCQHLDTPHNVRTVSAGIWLADHAQITSHVETIVKFNVPFTDSGSLQKQAGTMLLVYQCGGRVISMNQQTEQGRIVKSSRLTCNTWCWACLKHGCHGQQEGVEVWVLSLLCTSINMQPNDGKNNQEEHDEAENGQKGSC